jgi:hypothetical protein
LVIGIVCGVIVAGLFVLVLLLVLPVLLLVYQTVAMDRYNHLLRQIRRRSRRSPGYVSATCVDIALS